MALLLRTVRQNRWFKTPDVDALLNADDAPADPLGDVRTTNGTLSVWRLNDDRSNLVRIVRAVAVGQHEIRSQGYVVFDDALVNQAGIQIDNAARGNSSDDRANDWHCDLVKITANSLISLVKAILRHGESGVVLEKTLVASVLQGIENRELPESARAKCR